MVRLAWATAAVACSLMLASCSESQPTQEAGPVPFSTATSPTTTTTTSTPTPSPNPTRPSAPRLCSEVISFADVAQALSVPLDGGVRRVFATDFHPASGRTTRLTCTYGTLATASPAPDGDVSGPAVVEVNVSTYVDADAAATRLDGTVSSAQSGGQQVEAHEIFGRTGYFLRDDADVSYVIAEGDRTYVVTLLQGVVPDEAESVVLITLAETILGVTGTSAASPG